MKHKNLIYLCFENQTAVLTLIQELPANTQILESGQLHSGYPTILVSTENNFLKGQVQNTRDGIFVENPQLNLLKGYFKQLDTRAEKNLLVLESNKLGTLFLMVDQLLKTTTFELIEISRANTANQKAVAYLANGKAEEALMPASADMTVKLYETLTEPMKELFTK